MSNNTNDLLEEQVEVKRSFIQRYLQDPLSCALSKLATFLATPSPIQPHLLEKDRFEQYEFHPSEQKLYRGFADKVDPSVHYIFYFPFHYY